MAGDLPIEALRRSRWANNSGTCQARAPKQLVRQDGQRAGNRRPVGPGAGYAARHDNQQPGAPEIWPGWYSNNWMAWPARILAWQGQILAGGQQMRWGNRQGSGRQSFDRGETIRKALADQSEIVATLLGDIDVALNLRPGGQVGIVPHRPLGGQRDAPA